MPVLPFFWRASPTGLFAWYARLIEAWAIPPAHPPLPYPQVTSVPLSVTTSSRGWRWPSGIIDGVRTAPALVECLGAAPRVPQLPFSSVTNRTCRGRSAQGRGDDLRRRSLSRTRPGALFADGVGRGRATDRNVHRNRVPPTLPARVQEHRGGKASGPRVARVMPSVPAARRERATHAARGVGRRRNSGHAGRGSAATGVDRLTEPTQGRCGMIARPRTRFVEGRCDALLRAHPHGMTIVKKATENSWRPDRNDGPEIQRRRLCKRASAQRRSAPSRRGATRRERARRVRLEVQREKIKCSGKSPRGDLDQVPPRSKT